MPLHGYTGLWAYGFRNDYQKKSGFVPLLIIVLCLPPYTVQGGCVWALHGANRLEQAGGLEAQPSTVGHSKGS